jgi:hypothetical protein
MSVRDDLIAARGLIADPKHWTQMWFARAEGGALVVSRDTRACSWCALGALEKVAGVSSRFDKAFDALRVASFTAFARAAPEVNDDLGHEAILKAFDLAIQNAGEA